MTTPTPPLGFLGLPSLGDVVDKATGLLPDEVESAIKDTVGKILDPSDPSINIGDPQPEGTPPIPVEAGSSGLDKAVKALDTVIQALDIVLKLGGSFIPDKSEKVITDIRGALTTIRSWLI